MPNLVDQLTDDVIVTFKEDGGVTLQEMYLIKEQEALLELSYPPKVAEELNKLRDTDFATYRAICLSICTRHVNDCGLDALSIRCAATNHPSSQELHDFLNNESGSRARVGMLLVENG